MSDMSGAPIGQVFRYTYDGLTTDELIHAMSILLERPEPSSFAVTSNPDGTRTLRLSRHSYEYLLSQLTGAGR